MTNYFNQIKDIRKKISKHGNLSQEDFDGIKDFRHPKLVKFKKSVEKYIEKDEPVDLYIELSKKQLSKLASGDYCLEFPHGTEVKYKTGSRVVNVTCENKEVMKELIEGLDASYINWQIL